MHTEWMWLWLKDRGSSCKHWTASFSLDQARFSNRASKSGEQTILCLTVPSTDKSPVLPSVPTETSSWLIKGCGRKERDVKTYKHNWGDKEAERDCKQTWKKEHDVPSDTSRVTCPSMSCTLPDFLTSIFPIGPSRRSFKLQQFSSACSSCCVWK